MNIRLSLHELADRHGLDATARRRLLALAPAPHANTSLARHMARGLAVVAAALAGFGLVAWIAANWESLGRISRFGLLMAFIAVMGAGAALRPAARAPLALLAMLGMGALFAYIGQTYQTGADPWQLFALWAVLALPLCLGVRSDVLWAPWALVAMTGISLWTHAHLGHRWRVEPHDLSTHGVAWAMAAALVAGLSPALRRFTGAGVWALRTAATLAVAMTTFAALGGLFHDPVAPHYALGLLLMVAAAAVLCLPIAFDVFVLSAAALSIDTLVTCGLARALFDRRSSDDPVGALLMIGLVAAALLAGSVSVILRLARRHGAAGAKA